MFIFSFNSNCAFTNQRSQCTNRRKNWRQQCTKKDGDESIPPSFFVVALGYRLIGGLEELPPLPARAAITSAAPTPMATFAVVDVPTGAAAAAPVAGLPPAK